MKQKFVYRSENPTIQILHTADTHLGSRQYHNDIRRQDFFDSFEKVISDAIENEMTAVIHAGDFFDTRNPTIEDLIDTISILTKLKNSAIPFFGIVGNHESKQNTQWLDIFAEMGLAQRLGSEPTIIENDAFQIRFYGIDNLSAPRLDSFDFSVFQSEIDTDKKIYNLLALHQLLDPILPGQPLSADDFTNPIPIQFDAVLLGDNHKYECIRHNGAWMTYPGSTERCSASEIEPRAYNILTFDGADLSITRRNIITRDFIVISAEINENDSNPIENIFSKIDSYSEAIKDAVVFVELSGIKKSLISISEIEEYVKNKGAVVARVGDKRDLNKAESNAIGNIVFRDPDEVVTLELRKLNLTEAGLLLDGIIRDSETAKSRIDEESETKLKEFLESRDFSEEYKRSSVYSENDEQMTALLQNLKDEKDEDFQSNVEMPESNQEMQPIDEENQDSDSSISQDSEPIQKDERKSPRQYTLGDMFNAEDES
jgi:DNA repair exonuclease